MSISQSPGLNHSAILTPSTYSKLAKYRHLFARKGDYICPYNGPLRSPEDCTSTPSMYLFSDPSDPLADT